jgi:hypothetical protein
LRCHGTRRVTIKTLHGACAFVVQRFQCPMRGETTSLELTEQLCAGAMRARLGEFSAYDSNRMSYDEVAGLLERVTGQPVRSDQTMQPLVVAKAVEVSQPWQSESQADTAPPPSPAVTPQGDGYDPQSEAGLLLPDAMQVKQPKARRGQEADKPTGERETKRVHTEVWLVEQPTGAFTYLTAGIEARGQEVVAGTARVRWQFQQDYGGRSEPLPVVASTDGARTMRRQLAELCGQPVPVILDWDHLDKKVGELMSMVARDKQEKAVHVAHLLNHLWHGRTAIALTYLRRDVQAKNPQQLAALVTYLEKPRAEIIDDGRRQRAGKPIGSGRMEKGVDQVIGARQKHKGMSWSPTGSKALGILKVVELNQQWEQLWFPQQVAA